jgi:hypothetical protein
LIRAACPRFQRDALRFRSACPADGAGQGRKLLLLRNEYIARFFTTPWQMAILSHSYPESFTPGS